MITYNDLTPIERYSILKIADGEKLHISDAKVHLLELGLITGSGVDFALTEAGAAVVRPLRYGLKLNIAKFD